ncbi:uncharacterized protein F5891DRAFT_1222345 [Suillus fuscotomentosus]|uniref:Uncharacterized protein n=1 Tax=Suillus fuscotomentosus TaxID=1912939 RepID=A0AAD4DP04_9AGAM|nr:uncharacterized protein F5891DRAFT_1222345 [Suillus fuscotomentosus]KAG1887437.1 hypothetical protein F5891DRAFT_1222345 [Suillus fuscotomentosus]
MCTFAKAQWEAMPRTIASPSSCVPVQSSLAASTVTNWWQLLRLVKGSAWQAEIDAVAELINETFVALRLLPVDLWVTFRICHIGDIAPQLCSIPLHRQQLHIPKAMERHCRKPRQVQSYPRIIGDTGGRNFHVVHKLADIRNAVLRAFEALSIKIRSSLGSSRNALVRWWINNLSEEYEQVGSTTKLGISASSTGLFRREA